MEIKMFRVSPIGDYLELWLESFNKNNQEGCIIESIAIQSHKNYTEDYPENPDFEYILSNTDNPFKLVKRISFKDINIEETGFYFLYVKTNGYNDRVGKCNECLCKDVIKGVALHLTPLYNLVVDKVSLMLCDECSFDSSELADIYLKKNIILDAISLEDYHTAIDIWNKYLFFDIKRGDCNNSVYFGNRRYIAEKNIKSYNNCKSCG